MAILLKNLVARTPLLEDLTAVAELMASCDLVEHGIMDNTQEDLRSCWQRSDFNLAKDAWVIATTRGQIVGCGYVWREEPALISTVVHVHPEYRNRGIGTLLFRLVEVRARQHASLISPGTRVVLRSQVSATNRETLHLLEREGYQRGRISWRISLALAEPTGALMLPGAQDKLRVEVNLERGCLSGAALLYERDGLFTMQAYVVYEKELCSATKPDPEADEQLNTLDTLVSTF